MVGFTFDTATVHRDSGGIVVLAAPAQGFPHRWHFQLAPLCVVKIFAFLVLYAEFQNFSKSCDFRRESVTT